MTATQLSDLILKVRTKAGIETSAYITSAQTNVSDQFITDELNSAKSQLEAKMIAASVNWYTAKAQVTIAANAWTTNLPSDCLKLLTVDKLIGTDGYQRVLDKNEMEETRQPAPFSYGFGYATYNEARYELLGISATAPGGQIEVMPKNLAPATYLISYVPQLPALVNGTDTVVLPLQWHDYLITYAAISAKAKLMLPTDEEKESLARLEQVIVRGAARRGQPRRMLSLRQRRVWP